MIVFYIASNTYQEVISKSIKEADLILDGGECSNELYLYKYVKTNISAIMSVDLFVVDITVLQDTDQEIIEAFDMLRVMAYGTRIIVVAPSRNPGDFLLSKCFQMSIYDLICTDDFVELKQQLKYCLMQGKQYKDAIDFKEHKPQEQIITKTEIKQTVNKVMIGIAGTKRRIGTTHNVIILANFLRKKGFMVAIAEMNKFGAFTDIRNSFGETMLDEEYFSLNGVDFYPGADINKLGAVLGKSYNFILIDFGEFSLCDKVTFNKADVRLIIAGSKPWEIEAMNQIFVENDKETLKKYHYCFNFTLSKHQKDVKQGMAELEQVYFLKISEDPFSAYEFQDAEKILEQYMPVKIAQEIRKGIFHFNKRKG